MRRAPLIAFVAVLLVAAVPVWQYLTEQREVIASTPSAYTGVTAPIAVPGGSEACASLILFAADGGIMRFGATAPPDTTAPPLEVRASGDKTGRYRSDYSAAARVAGGWSGTRQLDVPLAPPAKDTFGSLCIRNLGSTAIELVGSENGRAASRPTVTVDGNEAPLELQLRIMEPGRHSVVSRLGEVTTHAATLKPFGAWWMWVLALSLLTLAPLGVWLVIRSALATDDAALGFDRPGPSFIWNSKRVRARLAAIPGWLVLALVAAVTTLWLGYWSVSTHVFQGDEYQYVILSRWLQGDFPASLFDFALYGRGLQRLEVWLLAIPAALFDSPGALYGGRILNVLAFVSTVIPVYKLGRAQGLSSLWAALPASVSIVVPWAVVATALLTENVGYPACFWALWAISRAAAAPSARRDLLALILLVVAGAARSGLLLLVPVLPVVIVATGLRCGTGPLGARARAVLRDHVVVWAAAVLGLLLLALGVGDLSNRLAGGYQTQLGFNLFDLLEKFGRYFAKVVIGTGFFPAAIGLPWVLIQLLRTRDPARFAFAALVVTSGLALLYSLNTAGPDERYVIYLAPLVLLSATLALARREISPAGLAIASVLLALLVLRVPWTAEQGPFGFFVSPVEMFYSRAVGLKLTKVLPGDVLTLVGLGLAVAGVMIAAALRWAPARLAGAPAIAIVVAVVAVVPAQAQYALSKYVNGAGSKSGPSLRDRAFVDTTVPAGATVGEFAEGAGQTTGYLPIWQELQFNNQRIDRVYAIGNSVNPVPPGIRLIDDLSFDERTGRITSPENLPDYLVIPTPVGAARVRGDVVSAPGYIAAALIRVSQPATLAWSAKGFDASGALPEGGSGVVRFYGTGLRPGPQCASFGLLAPPDRAASWTLHPAGSRPISGLVRAGQTQSLVFALPRLAERGSIDVRVSGDGVRVAGVGVGPRC